MSDHSATVRTRIDLGGLVRANVSCTNCGREIAAVAHLVGSVEIAGLSTYEWVHVWNGANVCTVTYDARPYDAWVATKAIEAARREPMDDEDECWSVADAETCGALL